MTSPARLGQRLLDTTTRVHPCDGELRPLGHQDWEPLAELASGRAEPAPPGRPGAARRPVAGPGTWRGRPAALG